MPKCGINKVAFEEEMVGKYQERKQTKTQNFVINTFSSTKDLEVSLV